MAGAAAVNLACRRQRYVLPKITAGVPADSRFSRYGATAAGTLPATVMTNRLKAWLLEVGGDPAAYGAPPVVEDVREAGVVAVPALPAVGGRGPDRRAPMDLGGGRAKVSFADGAEEDYDAIVFGTGFHLRLPFLDETVSRTLQLDDEHIDLADFTFHPDLPGLAFAGLIAQTGPYFPVLELQARYIAYAWGGACPAPDRAALEAGVEVYRATRGDRRVRPMHAVALRFARLAGVEPDVAAWPGLARSLLFGPLTAMSFRLSGPDALQDAAAVIEAEAVQHGTAPTRRFTARERELVSELAQASRDPAVRAWAALAAD